MGLDMYMEKVKKVSRGIATLYDERVFTEEEINDLMEDYKVMVEMAGERPVPEAFKKIALKIKAQQKVFIPMMVINAYFPDITVDDIKGWYDDVGKNEEKLFYFKTKDSEVEHEISMSKEEFEEKFETIEVFDAYMTKEPEEVYYWRKANQIREWFKNNLKEGIENCGYSSVTKEDLEKLISDCNTVLKSRDKAKDILPTSSGFFFGDTEYDEYYYEEIERTVEGMEKILKETDWETEAILYTEWW